MRIDEPGCDDQPADIDHSGHVPGIDRRQVVDRQDPVPEDADVRAAAGRAGAVHDGAAAEQEIEGRHALMMPPRTGH